MVEMKAMEKAVERAAAVVVEVVEVDD